MAPLPARLGPDRHADSRTETPRWPEHLGKLPGSRSLGGLGKVRRFPVQHLAWLQREADALVADDGRAPLLDRRARRVFPAHGDRHLARARARTCHTRDPIAGAFG